MGSTGKWVRGIFREVTKFKQVKLIHITPVLIFNGLGSSGVTGKAQKPETLMNSSAIQLKQFSFVSKLHGPDLVLQMGCYGTKQRQQIMLIASQAPARKSLALKSHNKLG